MQKPSLPRSTNSLTSIPTGKILLLALTALAFLPSLRADFVTIYQPHLRTFSDFIPVGETLEIHATFTANNGTATVTLPPELTFTGNYQIWNGSIDSVSFEGQNATIQVADGTTGGTIWFYAFAKPLSELPDTAPEVDITIAGEQTRSFTFKMLYQKLVLSSDTEDSVTEGDIITYTIETTSYPRDDLTSASLTIHPPRGTDLVENSILGAGDATISGHTITWASDPPTTLTLNYKVQVWEILLIDPSIKEIVTDRVSYRINASGTLRFADNVTGDPIEDNNFFSSSALSSPLSNKLDRNELELTLMPSKTNVVINEEFVVTATIKNITFSRFEDARLNTPSILFLGDQAAELIESPTVFLPPLLNNQEGTLEYRFKALTEGKFKISAEAIATATGSSSPTTSDPVLTEEICVGCKPVDVEIILPETEILKDEPFVAEIRVISNSEILQTVSFPNGLLSTSDPDFLKFEIPTIEPFELTSENPEQSFDVIILPLKYGSAILTTEIQAESQEGTENDSVEEDIFINPLLISITALPLIQNDSGGTEPIVNMVIKDDPENEGKFIVEDEKENVISPKLEVSVKNISDKNISVVLQGVDPKARDRSPVEGRIATVFPSAIDLGVIAPDKDKKKEVALNIVDDGRFDFTAIATGTIEGSTSQFNARGDGGTIAVGVPYPVEIEFKLERGQSDIVNQNNGAYFVTPGGQIKLLASITNKTSNSTLKYFGIEADRKLNAFGGIFTDNPGNATEPPFVHDYIIEANSGVVQSEDGEPGVLSTIIKTDENGAPSGTVKWILIPDHEDKKAILIDDLTQEETELTEDDFLIKGTVGGWLGDELTIKIIQDNSRPPKTNLTFGEEAAYFSYGVLVGMKNWTYDSMYSMGALGNFVGRELTPSTLADTLGEGSRAIWESAEMIHLGWTSMTQAEKDAFIVDAANETWRRGQSFVDSALKIETYTEGYEKTLQATQVLFKGLEDAYASDDPAKIAELYGRVSGNIAMEVISGYMPTPKFTQYVDGAELANLAKAADNLKAANQQQRLLRDIPSGTVSRFIAIEAWGVGGKFLDDVQEVLSNLKLKGYARERSPRSHTLSETLDEAVLKPQAMKPKGFNDLDALILADDLPPLPGKNGTDIGWDAVTVVYWPPKDNLIASRLRLKGESEEVIQAVLARANQRRKEYKKRFPELKEFKNGIKDSNGNFIEGKEPGIPIELDYKSNDAVAAVPNKEPRAKRNFDFDTIDTEGGARIHVPKMANAKGELRYITGDVDWVHFSHLDGSSLTAEEAGALYEILEHCCGLQHGETVTWINKGQAVFEGKAAQLAEYILGPKGTPGKALLEVSGEGLRAVRIQPNLTRFAKDARNHLIFFDGGSKVLQRAAQRADLSTQLGRIVDALPSRKVVLPFMWFTRNADFDDPTINGQEYSYNDAPTAVLAQQSDGEAETLEYFDGVEWRFWNQNTNPNPFELVSAKGASDVTVRDGEPINLTPTSILIDGILSGSSVLPIADFPTTWADQLGERVRKWFDVGDTIIIAAGTPQQEIRRIIDVDPFTVDHPLDFNHAEDTIVAVLPDILVDKVFTTEFIELKKIDRNKETATLAFEYSFPYNISGTLEISEDLENWTQGDLGTVMGGIQSQDSIKANYPGERIHISLIPPPQETLFLRWVETPQD